MPILAMEIPLISTLRRDSCTIQDSGLRGHDRPPAEAVRRSASVPLNAKATILVVDDEPDVREVLEEYFVAHGYAVFAAESAGAA
jgi:PleD family two-component response regulator